VRAEGDTRRERKKEYVRERSANKKRKREKQLLSERKIGDTACIKGHLKDKLKKEAK